MNTNIFKGNIQKVTVTPRYGRNDFPTIIPDKFDEEQTFIVGKDYHGMLCYITEIDAFGYATIELELVIFDSENDTKFTLFTKTQLRVDWEIKEIE